MKRELLIATIILSVVLFFSGCISSDVPTDTPIVLSKDNPSYDVVIRSDNSKVTWTFDDKSRVDEIPEGAKTAHFLLEYKDIPIGNHVLKVEDSDNNLEWQVQVVSAVKEEQQKQGGRLVNADGHNPTWEEQNGGPYPSWEEQVKIAAEKKKNKITNKSGS